MGRKYCELVICAFSVFINTLSLKEVRTQANRCQKGSPYNGLYSYSPLKCPRGHLAASLRRAHFHAQPDSSMFKDTHDLSLPPSYPPFLPIPLLFFFLTLKKLYNNEPMVSLHGAHSPYPTPPHQCTDSHEKEVTQPGRRMWIGQLIVLHSSPSHLPTVSNEIRRLRKVVIRFKINCIHHPM